VVAPGPGIRGQDQFRRHRGDRRGRQLYEAALDRLSREIAAVQRVTETEAVKEIEAALAKGPRRGPAKPSEEEEAVEDEAA
jgi:CarD family transcriptional regulator